ncbi:MAG: S26 family signal peptidase [Methanoregula sp.]|nr:S26 family signal peptidase [Methanoregula sp.]
MADKDKTRDIRTLFSQFRTSDHWAVSLARDLLWVVAVVGCIALALFLICGCWPAVVTIESESMVPNMNVGDLVVVVQKDRFGDLQTWDDGKTSGYQKFGDYGDVIIYRPNGATDMWASIGLLPLSQAQHPIIHRAMTWTEAGQPIPSYLNIYRGKVTPTGYLPLTVSGETVEGSKILSIENTASPVSNYTPGAKDLVMQTPQGNYVLPAGSIVPDSGYVRNTDTITTHGGYITKGDNNNFSDQGYLTIPGTGTVEPVAKEWIVGKALFTVPYVGLLPLHIGEVIIAVIILMVLHELYLRRKEETPEKPQKKSGKKQR